MRHARVKAEGTGCYHVVSRIVDRNFRLDDGEKEIFRRMMRKAEAFSGVRVLTYAVMSNHFHLLVEVPERGEVDEAELVRRMTALYGEAYVANRVKQWREWRDGGAASLAEAEQERLRARMGDVSAFVKTLKQRYSMSYNARHTRTGTLWEERFKSVLVENGENAKAAVAAYIDLNPVRAKIVADPKDYRWSGYGEACGGGRAAREGLIAVHDSRGYEQKGAWRLVSARYRTLLYVAGGERREAYTERVVRSGIKTREVDRVVGSGGKMTLQEALRCRVRYFTDGMAIGGKDFVERFFDDNRRLFGPKRKDGARKMRFAEWGDLRTVRALRIDPMTVPATT
ncbi:MAG TPA: transposase [Kiritimatiellia bacterium]|nr:MAG: Transposase IS200 like protein [Verrucomicrobia bacterium ADurb.Bin070]HQQ90438.1 transposase [Kiritimatiellia bacterium]